MEGGNNPVNDITLTVRDVAKIFNRRIIFENVGFSLSAGESLALTGKNGSGKSTLVKILCGVLSPSSGKIAYVVNGKILDVEQVKDKIGLVSPYLQLYDEFTGFENLEILSKIRANSVPISERADEVLRLVGLWERKNDFLRTYSSGMKQRLKYAFALLHRPPVLILDEPTSNLDAEGIDVVKNIIEEQQKAAILIVATNDNIEAEWCKRQIHLGR